MKPPQRLREGITLDTSFWIYLPPRTPFYKLHEYLPALFCKESLYGRDLPQHLYDSVKLECYTLVICAIKTKTSGLTEDLAAWNLPVMPLGEHFSIMISLRSCFFFVSPKFLALEMCARGTSRVCIMTLPEVPQMPPDAHANFRCKVSMVSFSKILNVLKATHYILPESSDVPGRLSVCFSGCPEPSAINFQLTTGGKVHSRP